MYFCSIESQKDKNEFQIFSNMKKMMILAVMMTATVSASAQSTPADPYFTSKEMPDMTKWCPGPPDTLSTAFAYDLMQYMWGKKMRNDKERADIAYRDAIFGVDYIVKEFSEPFGLQISKEDTPEIYRLLNDALATCDSICRYPKRHFKRMRPFIRFHEPTLRPEFDAELGPFRSFPSGHTTLGWSSALLLMEINPECADTILARGLMYGESRVILGAHWQSDVNAGRLGATAAYARLHSSERFQEQMRLARLEFRCKKGIATAAEQKTYKKILKKRNKK